MDGKFSNFFILDYLSHIFIEINETGIFNDHPTCARMLVRSLVDYNNLFSVLSWQIRFGYFTSWKDAVGGTVNLPERRFDHFLSNT